MCEVFTNWVWQGLARLLCQTDGEKGLLRSALGAYLAALWIHRSIKQ